MIIQNDLKKYKAKEDETTIYQHNKDLEYILNQLEISNNLKNQMKKIITYHDVGKVVSSFQENITNKYREIRHEMLSASVGCLTEEEMLVILTHHKPLKDIMPRFDTYSAEYKRELKEVEEKLGIEMIDIRDKLKKYKKINKDKILKTKKIIELKGLLNYCDHLGSSNIVEIEKGKDIRETLKYDRYTSVQEQAKNENEDILLIAATGSGKTEASLYWASNVDKKYNKRIFYVLPYCASITAMYNRLKEYMSVGMLHSKASYNLYKELKDIYKTKEEYQGYRYFTKYITVTTTHQIFKAVFNCKFNEMLLSRFESSIFIIDEIHSYNEKETALILQTLKYLKENYNIRICVMSASIPSKLKNLLIEELGITKELRLSDKELDQIKRHKIEYREKNIEKDIDKIKRELKKEKRIIVCVNTVAKSLEMYRLLKDAVKENEVTLINSYFNARDREKIEKKLKHAKLLIGTQAIEVSLDIDFDEMYTEISVIDSQIQRWGRINRKRTENLVERKNIYIYNTESKIYDEVLIARTKLLLKSLKNIEEKNIQIYLDSVYTEELKDYEKYKNVMQKILKNVQMGKWEQDKGYIKFTGVSVIPKCLEKEYRELIEEKKYYEANSLIVNISSYQFNKAKKEDAIACNNFGDKKEYMILYKYNSNEGLLLGEKES